MNLFPAATICVNALPVTDDDKFLVIGEDEIFNSMTVNDNATNPIANSSSDITHFGVVIPVLLKNVSQLTKASSQELYVQGIRWKVVAEKTSLNGVGTLTVYLQANDEDLGTEMSFKVVVDSKIIPVTGNKNPVDRKQTFSCHWGASKSELIKITGLPSLQNDYIRKDNINFLINLKVERDSIWDM